MLENFNLKAFIKFAEKAEIDISGLVGQLNSLNNSARDVGKSLVLMQGGVLGITSSTDTASKGMEKMLDGILNMKQATTSALSGLSMVGESLKDLWGADGFAGGLTAGKKAAGGFSILTANIAKMGDSLSTTVKGFETTRKGVIRLWTSMNSLVEVAKKTPGQFKSLLGSLRNTSVALGRASRQAVMFAAGMIRAAVTAIPGFVASLGPAIASAWAFTAALLANPVTLVVLGIIALGAAIFALVQHWDTVREAFLKAWGFIQEKIQATPTWLLALVAPFTLVIKFWDQIKAAGVAAWEFIRLAGIGLWTWIVNTFGKIKDVILAPIIGIWNWIKGLINQIFASKLAGFISGAIGIDVSKFQALTAATPPKVVTPKAATPSGTPLTRSFAPAQSTVGNQEITIDNKIVIDGREIAKATGRQRIENAERSGRTLSPGDKREILESGGIPAMAG